MADFATSAAATGLASKQGGDGKGVMGGKLGREMVVVLFKKWVRSEDRTKARTEKIPVFCTADNRRMLEVSMMFKTPSGTDPAGQVGRGELNSSLRSTARYQQIVPQRRPEAGVLAETRRHVRTARQG